MTRRVAITGASGFVGSHIGAALASSGVALRLLTHRREPSFPGALQAQQVRGPITDRAALTALVDGCETVVHVAGAVRAANRDAYDRINARPIAELVSVCREQPSAPRLILISSLAARHPDLSAYAASKRAGEECVRAEDRIPWLIIRPPAVYGPEDTAVLPFFKAAARGWLPIPAAGPHARFSVIHAADLAALTAAAVCQGFMPQTVIEADDGMPGGHDWHTFARAMAGAMGTKAQPIAVPRSALTVAALGMAGLGRLGLMRPMLTRDKVGELFHSDWVCRRGATALPADWRPRFDLHAGLSDTAAWYRRHGWL